MSDAVPRLRRRDGNELLAIEFAALPPELLPRSTTIQDSAALLHHSCNTPSVRPRQLRGTTASTSAISITALRWSIPRVTARKTVQLETGYKRLLGSQAPGVNNGQTLTSVTLQDRDGIILMKLAPQVRPNPPGNVTVTQNWRTSPQ
jgi:hypothetical protein